MANDAANVRGENVTFFMPSVRAFAECLFTLIMLCGCHEVSGFVNGPPSWELIENTLPEFAIAEAEYEGVYSNSDKPTFVFRYVVDEGALQSTLDQIHTSAAAKGWLVTSGDDDMIDLELEAPTSDGRLAGSYSLARVHPHPESNLIVVAVVHSNVSDPSSKVVQRRTKQWFATVWREHGAVE